MAQSSVNKDLEKENIVAKSSEISRKDLMNLRILQKAVFEDFPYVEAVLNCIPMKVDNVYTPTLSIEEEESGKVHINVNLDFLGKHTEMQQEGLMMHEMFHYILNHFERGKVLMETYPELDASILGQAMDAEVNSVIHLVEKFGLTSGITNKNFIRSITGGMKNEELPIETSFEQYMQIADSYRKKNQLNNGLNGDSDISVAMNGNSESKNNKKGDNQKGKGNQSSEKSSNSGKKLVKGIGDDADVHVFNTESNNKNSSDKVAKKLKNAIIRNTLIKKILEHEKCPGNLKSLTQLSSSVTKKAQPELWDKVLRRIISTDYAIVRGDDEVSRHVFNRRNCVLQGGPIIAGRFDPEFEYHLGLVVDISGSMYLELEKVMRIVASLSESNKELKIDIYYVDTEVEKVLYNVSKTQVVKLPRFDGGGTDMEAGIDACFRASIKYDAIIVLTDGYTEWRNDRPIREKKLIKVIQVGDCNDRSEYKTFLASK